MRGCSRTDARAACSWGCGLNTLRLKNMMKIVTIGLLALVAGLADPATLTAQAARPIPTPASALANMRESGNSDDAHDILTQRHGYRPRSELDAFADSLVVLAIEHERTGLILSPALEALWTSALPEEGDPIPYTGAYEAIERVFAATLSWDALAYMAEVDPHRARPLVLERVMASDREVACQANVILQYRLEGGEELRRKLMDSGALVHHCSVGHFDTLIMVDPIEPQLPPPFRGILAAVEAGDSAASRQAVNILTGVGEWRHFDEQAWLVDSLVALASSGDGDSAVAARAWEVLERSAHPPDTVQWYALTYEAVFRVFEATGSQAALESLARIETGSPTWLLADMASRDAAVSCRARAVLAQMNDGPRLLREMRDAGMLAYQCPGGM